MKTARTEAPQERSRLELVWRNSSSTKFRTPRLRRDIVAREALVGRALASALERRVTLICAPAGAGKSTLLTQVALACEEAAVVWLSLDEDDSDPNRLFVSLLTALGGVDLEWAIDARTLASQVLDDSSSSRAAVALIINALCSFDGERLLLILDDLHRVTHPQALRLLNHLIELLPPEVGVVIGTRVLPELSLARWRSQGELGELSMSDLQFDAVDAAALARARLPGGGSAELVNDALRRTQGWAAGLQLMLGASQRSAGMVGSHPSNRHMFDFLAHEVLAELPDGLREFVLRCSILAELSPESCRALMPDADVHQMLDELYRRNLFVFVLDENEPKLRFHDLFRDFLERELEQRHPELMRALHARAAEAESSSPRAMTHWLKAERWHEAIALMHSCIEPLLFEGGHATVERWISLLPAAVSSGHEVTHLRGLCAWARWDWPVASRHLESAAAAYRERGDETGYARALTLLPRSYNASGDLESAARVLAELGARSERLDDKQRARLTAARAWQAIAEEPDRVAGHLHALVHQIERDSSLVFAVEDMFNSLLYGFPGTVAPLRRLRELAEAATRRGESQWQVQALACCVWPDLWRGERAVTSAAIARQTAFAERFSIIKALQLNAWQSDAVYAAATGDFERADASERRLLEAMDALGMPLFRRTWRRLSLQNLACVHWMAQSAEGLRPVVRELEPERDPREWPAVETGRALAFGRLALLEGNMRAAEQHLRRACELAGRWRLPTFMSDPRISLAILRLRQGDRGAAWTSFEPVFRQAMDEDCLGPLLMEPSVPLDRVLALMPADLRAQPAAQSLLRRMREWRVAAPASSDARGPLAALSAREREVLERIAAGDSNKLIARALELSPHTVKRHVANILDKLAVSTRSAAAALYRQYR